MFKGKRTYGAIAAIVIIAGMAVLESVVILSPEITASIIGLLGALAVYFRHEA